MDLMSHVLDFAISAVKPSDSAYQLSETEGAIKISVNMLATNAQATITALVYTAMRRRLKPCGISHQ